ncbi:hypothetical protein [Luteipulveratus flavus]|uniref:DUF2470 domain-containing protein n=1 Tax=Luteipulveratus flavus TaxID=3031728 RepID=A0ABT6C256_9MICO|nr:hypothetical protein [Luteipulveratus sp. YIM 133296]MDF8262823.1 hypothetical protein [Luteipulveratus sp. YIM 133296]
MSGATLSVTAQYGELRERATVVRTGGGFEVTSEHIGSAAPPRCIVRREVASLLDAVHGLVRRPAVPETTSDGAGPPYASAGDVSTAGAASAASGVAVEDVPLLTSLVRRGAADELAEALRVCGMPVLPPWLAEAAFGLDGVLSCEVSAGDRHGRIDVQLLRSTWVRLRLDREHRVHAERLAVADVRRLLTSACTTWLLPATVGAAA